MLHGVKVDPWNDATLIPHKHQGFQGERKGSNILSRKPSTD